MTMDQRPFDHIGRALERAQSEQRGSVRNWVRPTAEAPATDLKVPPKRTVSLSEAHLHANHVLCGRGTEDPGISDRYRLLRTRVLHALKAAELSSIGVTSPGPKEGKSLTSINLAISIAREGGNRVVLVDSDLRKPSIADTLGIEGRHGLIDYLTTELDYEDVLLATDVANLFVLPGRREEGTHAVPELLSSPKMRRLLEQGRHRHDAVMIVDMPPVRVGDDVVALAPYLDSLLVVVREGVTESGELKDAIDLLRDFTILGSVLNDSASRKVQYEGYYYHAAGERT